ncbi:MAG: single-stranded DNA-binding protein [Chloroflexota bacterium]
MLKATIVGNLGRDPDEPRYTSDGRPFVRFNVASTYRGRGQDGDNQERTEWIRVTAFGRLAEVVSQYLRRGSRVYVEGRLETRPWIDNQQQPQAGLEVLANDIQFMSNRSDDEGGRGPRDGGGPPPRSGGGGRSEQQGPPDNDLDDLPF